MKSYEEVRQILISEGYFSPMPNHWVQRKEQMAMEWIHSDNKWSWFLSSGGAIKTSFTGNTHKEAIEHLLFEA
ncbi:hypothetical protein OAL13_00160 [bacterium]|nr:hypothetical protein [bacterium]